MTTKKLTMESVVEKIIWNEIVTGSSGTKDNTISAQVLMKVFLEQIRDEYEDINNGMSHDEIEKRIKTLKMFDKYLNEKGGK